MDHPSRQGERVLGMRSSGVAKALTGCFLFFSASWGTIVGCSSDEAAAPSPAPRAGICPNTVQTAVGAACSQEGLDCPIGYTCGAVLEQAHCLCTHGKYVCTDATLAVVSAKGEPACVPAGVGNDKQCPASEQGTDAMACTTAGLLCYYNGPVCPEGNGVPNRDVCQCKGSPLQFECEQQLCNPRSDASSNFDQFVPPVDSAVPDATHD